MGESKAQDTMVEEPKKWYEAIVCHSLKEGRAARNAAECDTSVFPVRQKQVPMTAHSHTTALDRHPSFPSFILLPPPPFHTVELRTRSSVKATVFHMSVYLCGATVLGEGVLRTP